MPCHPARARQLMRKGRAAVYRRYPFTIIIKEREGGDTQPTALKFDPGAKTTGIAVVVDCKR
ncbi:MAG: HNH endonuclease, partial [Deltaproteobacteria bacterium]|nr:HNH endonuclease [Deltaproteobacteria bacterium]